MSHSEEDYGEMEITGKEATKFCEHQSSLMTGSAGQ
jgi:hypothetical protein